MTRRKKKLLSRPQPREAVSRWRGLIRHFFAFLTGSGILIALFGTTYLHYAGNVSFEFVQAIGRAYEFQFKNDTPSDRTVKLFRIEPPRGQKVIYTSTEDVYAHVDKSGQVTLPGGNFSYVPAAEYKELDGQRVSANSTLKFRVPPLSSRSWMAPEATIVDVRFELESSNTMLEIIEGSLDTLGIRSRTRIIRYLVINNYWTVSQSTSLDEAIRVYCRDNDTLSKPGACAAGH